MVRHSAVYVGGTALQGLGVLIILPFATRLLGPAEFGRVAAGLVVVQCSALSPAPAFRRSS